MHKGMDVDQNGDVSREEFLKTWSDLNVLRDVDGDGLMSLEEYGPASFEYTDSNNDNYISYEEDNALRRKHFKATDLNNDGVLTYAEFFEVHNGSAPPAKSESVKTPIEAVQMDFDVEIDQFEALARLTDAPQLWSAEGYEATEKMAAVYYDGLDWKGNSTKVFAWLGLPDDLSKPVPAVVLVHGGGGTAFKSWVTEWTQRGYAAISISVEGQTDVRDESGSPHSNWEQHEWAGPQRSGIYHDSDQPFKDQWMYHAVANTILANSLLRSLPEVDADKVGVMGISWGGVITSTVIGIDSRFAFAIPVYGCGGLSVAQNEYGQALGDNGLYQQVLDPLLRIDRVLTPTLWFSWPEDTHFPLDTQASCYNRQLGEHMVSLVPEMGHGHGPAWLRPESYAFADSVLAGKAWCRQVDSRIENEILFVDFNASKVLDEAYIMWTSDRGATGTRKWTKQQASIHKQGDVWTALARVPDAATATFMNVQSGDLIATSDYIDIQ